ncbi:MAG: c-type cytochrome [Candidatus Krumholzibacteria bacterium]|nr:c-type cytochrome [Candidatus Krumholzibacteria bacterium]
MKINTTIKVLLVVLILTGLAVTALAEDDVTKEVKKETKKMSGKELFVAHCKVCHMEDADAGEYTPISLIMDQWDEFYDETFVETHKEVACPKEKDKMVTDMIDKDMIKKLRKFCVDHAADSEQPMTCG